jgi:glucosamine--fructose-6-phosphate aminotransferase (isomerizing)
MKEVALIHSEGILAGEMKHGPLALVDEHMPIVVVVRGCKKGEGWGCGGAALVPCSRCCCLVEHPTNILPLPPTPSPPPPTKKTNSKKKATRDATYQKMTSVVEQLLARGAKLVILCNEGDATMRNYAAAHGCRLIEVPRTADALQPVVNIVPLQLLAYHATVLRGFNVDQPRNLAKSVTVTD